MKRLIHLLAGFTTLLVAGCVSLPTSQGNQKIVGGVLVRPGAAPWQVSLFWADMSPSAGHFCGGSLIADQWVLTAAHCISDKTKADYRVFLGSQDLRATGAVVAPLEQIPAPGWKRRTMENDLALVRITATDNPTVGYRVAKIPVLAPGRESEATGSTSDLTVTGYGRLSDGGPLSPQLLQVTIRRVDLNLCNSRDYYNGRARGQVLCAGAPKKDSCQGDSGGPLTTRVDGVPTLVGVVSWGDGCAARKRPGIYTRVAPYGPWMRDVLAGLRPST